jgi:uncharacterized protein YxjI
MSEQLQHMLMRNAIVVKQEKEMANILVGFDSANKYSLHGENGEALGSAMEEGGGFGGAILRQMFGNMRSLTLHVYDAQGQEIASGKKPFRFMFQEITGSVGGQVMGRSRRRFKMLKRRYTIDVGGVDTFEINSSIFQLGSLTFDVTKGGVHVATISKKWKGLLTEMFTQADTFSIQFVDANLTLQERATLFFTLFLIDYDVFEQKSGSSAGVVG